MTGQLVTSRRHIVVMPDSTAAAPRYWTGRKDAFQQPEATAWASDAVTFGTIGQALAAARQAGLPGGIYTKAIIETMRLVTR
jgi:hypothetical protein